MMSLGKKLLALRKKAGLSQKEVAEKVGVSRQTVSKWETDQTIPELSKVQSLSQLYNVSYDYFICGSHVNDDVTSIETIIDEIDWTSAWSKKYPILASYQGLTGIEVYRQKMSALHDALKSEFDFDDLDAFLVLKDILYQQYKATKKTAR